MIITHPLSTHPLGVDIPLFSAARAFSRSTIIMIIKHPLQLRLASVRFSRSCFIPVSGFLDFSITLATFPHRVQPEDAASRLLDYGFLALDTQITDCEHAFGQHDSSENCIFLIPRSYLQNHSFPNSNPSSTTPQVQDERMLSRHDPGSNAPDNLLCCFGINTSSDVYHKFFHFKS
jgi:hypothetical protein